MVSIVDKWHVLIRGRHEVLVVRYSTASEPLCASVFTLSVLISAIRDDYDTARYTIPVYEILLFEESCNICMMYHGRLHAKFSASSESSCPRITSPICLEEGAT